LRAGLFFFFFFYHLHTLIYNTLICSLLYKLISYCTWTIIFIFLFFRFFFCFVFLFYARYQTRTRTHPDDVPDTKPFEPLPHGHYPIFNKVPKRKVLYQIREVERIRREEEAHLAKKREQINRVAAFSGAAQVMF